MARIRVSRIGGNDALWNDRPWRVRAPETVLTRITWRSGGSGIKHLEQLRALLEHRRGEGSAGSLNSPRNGMGTFTHPGGEPVVGNLLASLPNSHQACSVRSAGDLLEATLRGVLGHQPAGWRGCDPEDRGCAWNTGAPSPGRGSPETSMEGCSDPAASL